MSKFKKITALVLSVIMLVCIFSVPTSAKTYATPTVSIYDEGSRIGIYFAIPSEVFDLWKSEKAIASNESTLFVHVFFDNWLIEATYNSDGMMIHGVFEYLDSQWTFYTSDPNLPVGYTGEGTHAFIYSFDSTTEIGKCLKKNPELTYLCYLKSNGKILYGDEEVHTIKKTDNNLTEANGQNNSLPTDITVLSYSILNDQVYSGKKITPNITVRNESNMKLTKDKDYSISYKNNKDIGTARIVITGKGEYSGTKIISFDIVPAKTSLLVKKSSSGYSLSWKSVKATYQNMRFTTPKMVVKHTKKQKTSLLLKPVRI